MLTQTQIRTYWSPRCTGPWGTVSLYGAGKVTVRAAVVPAVKALNQVLTAYKYATHAADTGAYNCRLNTSGTAWSMHAYGIACDINWLSNPYDDHLVTDMFKYGDGRMPYRITAIKTNNGKQVWNWGGFWSGNKDAMHYEIVCAPADLATGINWSTVYSGTVTPTPQPAPEAPTGDLVYRIYWFKGEPTASGDQPTATAAYRVLCAKAEKRPAGQDPYLAVSAWWIKDAAELKVWRDRGLLEDKTAKPLRGSIEYFNGPFDNTKTV